MSNKNNNNKNTSNTKPANQAAASNKANSLSPDKKNNASELPSQKVIVVEPEETKEDAGSEKMEDEGSSQGGKK